MICRDVSGRRARRGFTIVEIIICVSLLVLVASYVTETFLFASHSERATSKKLLASRALQYLQGRIRRDAKWARRVKVLDGNGAKGKGVEFSDVAGQKRTYLWHADSKKLDLPELTAPSTSTTYKDCKFRLVEFYQTEDKGEGLRVVMSPLPMDEKEEFVGDKEAVWGAAMVGRAELNAFTSRNRYALFNEPEYPPGGPL